MALQQVPYHSSASQVAPQAPHAAAVTALGRIIEQNRRGATQNPPSTLETYEQVKDLLERLEYQIRITKANVSRLNLKKSDKEERQDWNEAMQELENLRNNNESIIDIAKKELLRSPPSAVSATMYNHLCEFLRNAIMTMNHVDEMFAALWKAREDSDDRLHRRNKESQEIWTSRIDQYSQGR